MNKIMLFTDGSVHAKLKVGYGAYLIVTNNSLSLDELKSMVKVKRFEQTSSTKLEIQILLWALSNEAIKDKEIVVYTDSQNIISLPARQNRLEQNNYKSKKNSIIDMHELYKQFFKLNHEHNCKFIKVKGHRVKAEKDYIDQIFTLVDRASRNALRTALT